MFAAELVPGKSVSEGGRLLVEDPLVLQELGLLQVLGSEVVEALITTG